MVLLPYGPNSTSGWVSRAARILVFTSLPVSRTSRSTPIHGGGRRAACSAHRVSPVAQACPNGASGPVKGVTSAARRVVMTYFLVSQRSNCSSYKKFYEKGKQRSAYARTNDRSSQHSVLFKNFYWRFRFFHCPIKHR